MPEINEAPRTTPVLAKSNLGGLLESVTAPSGTEILDPSGITQRIKIAQRKISTAHPNLSQEKIDLMSHLAFGPWMSENVFAANSAETYEHKELNSRIQQHLVHTVLYAGSENASPSYTENAYDLIAQYEKLAKMSIGTPIGANLFISAIRSEIGIIRTLTDKGCTVYLPDYTTKSDVSNGLRSETLDWDLEFGTDFIAVTADGRMLFIDAKGQRFFPKDPRNPDAPQQERDRVDVVSKVLPRENPIPEHLTTLRKGVGRIRHEKKLGTKSIVKATITVPTGSTEMYRLGDSSNSANKKEGLNRFGTLQTRHKDAIIVGLTGAIKDARNKD
jgi:hypothetical protein